MVAVPAVQDRLDLPGRDGGDDGPGGLRVVSLTRSVFVEVGVVHHPPWGAVSLRCNYHTAGPGDGVVDWDSLQDTETNISVKAILDGLLPVERNLTGRVNCHWFGFLVYKHSQRRSAVHQSERLVLATVEG